MGSTGRGVTIMHFRGGRGCVERGGFMYMWGVSSHHKDAGSLNMSDVVSAVASKMTSAVLGKLSQAG